MALLVSGSNVVVDTEHSRGYRSLPGRQEALVGMVYSLY